jgi:hypothetical protein
VAVRPGSDLGCGTFVPNHLAEQANGSMLDHGPADTPDHSIIRGARAGDVRCVSGESGVPLIAEIAARPG